jgi:hypothetical protein
MTSYWIIMADIIDSGQNEAVLMQNQFKECVEIVNKKYHKMLVSPLTITLGDEFQGLLNSLSSCVKTSIFMEELIVEKGYNFTLRYVVNYGKIDTPINHEIAYGMLGEGLTNARELLNSLKKTDRRFNFELGKPKKTDAINNAFEIFESLTAKWKTNDDKEMASLFIKYSDYKIIAEKLDKPRSQIWKRRHSLEINSYFAIKKLLYYLV